MSDDDHDRKTHPHLLEEALDADGHVELVGVGVLPAGLGSLNGSRAQLKVLAGIHLLVHLAVLCAL
jgi:hypothetical protein